MKSFKRLLSIVLTIAILTASFVTVSAANDYKGSEYWAAEALASAVQNGILQGKENGNLDPTGLLTRAEMAAIIVRAFGATIETDISSYSDLIPGAWYYSDFAKAVHMGVFTGTGNGKMSPSNNITREEAFTVFSRAMVYESENLSSLSRYNDSASISQWATKYVAPLASRGYVNGDDLGNFNPKANITRAEFAQFMHNMFKTYITNSGTHSKVGADCVMIRGENITLTDVTVEGDLVIGDGAGRGKIVLKNVDVKGRILVRGAATIQLVNTTVGDHIVVKNINNTVHFDNYRDYPAFKNISELTKVTYKTRGSSSSSANVTVTFKEQGNTLKEVTVKSGNTVDSSVFPNPTDFPLVQFSDDGYVKDSSISPTLYTTPYTHVINFGWWYNDGSKHVPFTSETVVTEDITAELMPKTFKAQAYIESASRGLTLDAYFEGSTRYADTLKDIIFKNKTRVLAAEGMLSAETKFKQQLIDFGVIDSSDNILIQSIGMKFADIIGEDNVEETIIDSANDLFASNAALEAEISDYLVMHAESTDPAEVQVAKDLITSAMRNEVSTSEGMIAAKDMLEDFLNDPVDTTFYDMVVVALENEGVNVSLLDKPTIISIVLATFETDGSFREEVITSFTDYVISNTDVIVSIVDTIIDYIDSHPDVREQIVEDIIETVYQDTFDLLLDQIINEEEFDVTPDNYFVAEGLQVKVNETTIYAIKSMIPAKVFVIYPEDKLAEIFDDAKARLLADIAEAIDDAKHGRNAKIASGFTFIVDPVEDVYKPVHERLIEILEGRFGANYYYNENEYLQELIALSDWENVFTYDAALKTSTISGYKIRTIEHYYDLLLKVVIIGDDAMLWYKDNLTTAQIETLMNDYEALILKYVNIFARIAGDYATNGTIPSVPGSQFITRIENVIKTKYPNLVDKLIDKYNNSDILKDIYTNEDYTKLKERVKDAFNNVNLTTDEFFDKVLKKGAEAGKVTKISDDEYRIDYDANYINIRRVLE